MSRPQRILPESRDGAPRRVHVVQGQYYVTTDPAIVLTTALGSCVAACIRDPLLGLGGMNHFLLPDGSDASGAEATRYGAYAMELLINGLMGAGARRERLEAKIFGGGQMADRTIDVGGRNVEFARSFLEREGILLVGGSTGGSHVRKIEYWPTTGRARQRLLIGQDQEVFGSEKPVQAQDAGSVELFG